MKVKLDDYIKEKINQYGYKNPFYGFDDNGTVIDSWHIGIAGLEIYGGYIRNSKWVIVDILKTKTGIEPDYNRYYWKGKINSNVCNKIIWWSFELLTEDEANVFLYKNSPEIIFTFFYNGIRNNIHVIFQDFDWYIL